MTFADDFMLFHMAGDRDVHISCAEIGIEWPPPQTCEFCGFPFKRVSMSAITDAQRQGLSYVMRGAEYLPDADATPRAAQIPAGQLQ